MRMKERMRLARNWWSVPGWGGEESAKYGTGIHNKTHILAECQSKMGSTTRYSTSVAYCSVESLTLSWGDG